MIPIGGADGERVVAEQVYEQSRRLTPGKRLAVGAAMLASAFALWFDERGRWIPQLPWLLSVLGAVVVASALRARAAQRRLEREMADVLERWEHFEAGVRAAETAGASPVRWLQAQGITRFEVRRFVLRKLRGEALPARTGPAAAGVAAAYLPGKRDVRDVTTPPWGSRF